MQHLARITTAAALLAKCLVALAETEKAGPIQDNSFLVEEAYNQEAGVVQHISTFQRTRGSGDWVYTFTQEWPIGSQAHQFSFTVPLTRQGASSDGKTGAGDLALNYRFQWIGDGDADLAVAPRFTVVLPTGQYRQGRGNGAVGYQAQLPLSWVFSDSLVSHSNLGVTITPDAKDLSGNRASINAWNFGQSVVWLVKPRFNLMLEWAYSRNQTVAGPGSVGVARTSLLSAGARWAIDLPSGMQVVPGIAIPVGIGPSRGTRSVFFYLSFEHPFAGKAAGT